MSRTLPFHGRADVALPAPGDVPQTSGHDVTYGAQLRYEFEPHFHAHASRLVARLLRKGIDGLQAIDTEFAPGKNLPDGSPQPLLYNDFFTERYTPQSDPTKPAFVETKTESGNPAPAKQLDFGYGAGYSVYNWELFLHVPLTLALHLSKNGRYEAAQRWFHYVFDPTEDSDEPVPQKYWKVLPLRMGVVPQIEQLLVNLSTGADTALRDDTLRAIGAWRDQPLSPHVIARMRPSAYMIRTVMGYLDNIIQWGDSLFREDTRESINRAVQIYMLGAKILGPRPEMVPRVGKPATQSYASVSARLDGFSDALAEIEAEIPFDTVPSVPVGAGEVDPGATSGIGSVLYFCVPRNDRLLSYWDAIGQRLFNIRNSLDINGTFRQLPLTAPPLDPGVLANAIAAGVDVAAVVSGADDAPGPVRFPQLLQRAVELCQEVKALGSLILSALEKKDAEALALLRARHETSLSSAAEAVRLGQWHEATKNRDAIWGSIRAAYARFSYYEQLLGRQPAPLPSWQPLGIDDAFSSRLRSMEPRLVGQPVRVENDPRGGALAQGAKLNRNEVAELVLLAESQSAQDAAGVLDGIAAAMNIIPGFSANLEPFGIGASISFGGSNIAAIFSSMSAGVRGLASRVAYEANRAAKVGTYARREQEWAFQSNAAAAEITQLFSQLRAAELREHVAGREVLNQQRQSADARDVENFLVNERRKKSNEALYVWLKREARSLHARYFELAYETAVKALAAFRLESNDLVPELLRGQYLSGKEGLYAGESLLLDLKRMELAYAESRVRELELTKRISVRDWSPAALARFRATGQCELEIPEALFDLDAPGHYLRRIKSVALSLPCITGPYANVHCQLTLLSSRVRVSKNLAGGTWGPADPNTNDERLREIPCFTNTIVTSSTQEDTGTFDATLHDERPLPFEGAGAISRWQITLLDRNLRQFDYDSIADVILTLRFTARPAVAGELVAPEVAAWLADHSAQMFSIRHEFPSEWARFKNPGSGNARLDLAFADEHFPLRLQGILAKARSLRFYAHAAGPLSIDVARAGVAWGVCNIAAGEGSLVPSFPGSAGTFDLRGSLSLSSSTRDIDDLWLVVDWTP